MTEANNSFAIAEVIGNTDHKGRPLAATMSDRQMAEETLILLRAFGDALEVISNNPMLQMMMPPGVLPQGK